MRRLLLGILCCAGCVSEGTVLGDHGLPDIADLADAVVQVPGPPPDVVEIAGDRLIAYATGTPTMWLGDCSMTFDAGIHVALADDLLLVSTPATCRTYLYAGDASCESAPTAELVVPCGGASFARGVGDLDRDGLGDVVVAETGGRAWLFYGGARVAGLLTEADADAVFVPGATDTDFANHVAPAGDTDGDGAADFFITVHGASLLFRGGIERFSGEVAPDRAAARFDDDAIGLHAPLGIGDLDGDERDDFALNGFVALYSLYYGRDDAYQAPEAALVGTEVGSSDTSIRTADLDGDGQSDLAIRDPQMFIDDHTFGGIHVLFGSGRLSGAVSLLEQSATWVLGEDDDLDGQPVPTSIATGDLDGDGLDDLAIAVPGVARIYVLFGPLPRRE